MVEQNQQQTAGGNRRPNHIPIGEDHLQFKNDQQIMDQLAERGKKAFVHTDLFIIPSHSLPPSLALKQIHPSINQSVSLCASIVLTWRIWPKIISTSCLISFNFLENIVFSCQVLKYNRFGMKQTRNLLLTTHQICNVKDRGKYPIQSNQAKKKTFDRFTDPRRFNQFYSFPKIYSTSKSDGTI